MFYICYQLLWTLIRQLVWIRSLMSWDFSTWQFAVNSMSARYSFTYLSFSAYFFTTTVLDREMVLIYWIFDVHRVMWCCPNWDFMEFAIRISLITYLKNNNPWFVEMSLFHSLYLKLNLLNCRQKNIIIHDFMYNYCSIYSIKNRQDACNYLNWSFNVALHCQGSS